MKIIIKYTLGPVLFSAFIATLLFPSFTQAASFSPDNIIDDAVFYNSNTMTVSQIQSFLNGKVPSCDTQGAQRATDKGRPDITRAQYAKQRGWHAPPYTCIKNFKQTTTAKARDAYCNGYSRVTNQSAAQIIHGVAKSCGINPQSLIVLLQKEQALITDVWPLNIQYRSATGMGCPDTAACDSQYYGFFNQVYHAARQFKLYQAAPNSFNYRAGRNNTILWHPNSSCGSSTVRIQNQATAGLYNYTPYRPNQSALNAGYGTGNSCSSYGNRNFWLYFTNWFGSVHANFIPLKEQRWLETKSATYKRNPGTNEAIDTVIPAGTQIYFPKKINVNGKTYLQTKHDVSNGLGKGILFSDLKEISVDYASLLRPRWMEVTKDTHKVNPITNKKTGGVLSKGTKIFFSSKIDVGGSTYLRTRNDTDRKEQTGIQINSLRDVNPAYTGLTQARWLEASSNTSAIDIGTNSPFGETILKGQQKFFKYKVIINGQTFVSESLPQPGVVTGVPLSSLRNVPAIYRPLKYPRWFTLRSDTHKINPMTETQIGNLVPAETKIYFTEKIYVGQKEYLRTDFGSRKNLNEGFLSSSLKEDYVSMTQPRTMTTIKQLHKRNPSTNEVTGNPIAANTVLHFTTKVTIGPTTYLRTQSDSSSNLDIAIPIYELR